MFLFQRIRHTHSCLMAALLACCIAQTALADDNKLNMSLLTTYKTECSACHVAYPPGLLPAPSWGRLMRNLPHHFGVDASLDAVAQGSILSWLEAHAGANREVRDGPPEDRITRSVWFVRQHREIAQATWKRSAIKSVSNCQACHARADHGDFDEDTVRIPK